MTLQEAYEALQVCGLQLPGLKSFPESCVVDVPIRIRASDGTEDVVRRNIALAFVLALVEASGSLESCVTVKELEIASAEFFAMQMERGKTDETAGAAIARAVEIEIMQIERTWHERKYKDN